MKNRLKIAGSFLVCLLLVINISVESKAGTVGSTRTWNGFVYTGFEDAENPELNIDKSECHLTILNYKGTKREITIPKKIDGIKVTQVWSLSKAKNLQTLHIPNGVEITHAIVTAPKLKKITVRKDNKEYSVKNNALLNKKGTVLLSYPGGYSTLKVPDSVTKIEGSAFFGAKFRAVQFGKKLKIIENGAFYENYNLKTITTSKNLQTIGITAFYGCTKLRKVVVTKNVKRIEESAFAECNKLKEIYIYNPNCKIAKNVAYYPTIPKCATIYGKKGSTAEKYAKRYKMKFVVIP